MHAEAHNPGEVNTNRAWHRSDGAEWQLSRRCCWKAESLTVSAVTVGMLHVVVGTALRGGCGPHVDVAADGETAIERDACAPNQLPATAGVPN